jgi:hypothetical protein
MNIENKLKTFISNRKPKPVHSLRDYITYSHTTFKSRVALRNWKMGKSTFWDFCECCDEHKQFLITEYLKRLGDNNCKKCHDLKMSY